MPQGSLLAPLVLVGPASQGRKFKKHVSFGMSACMCMVRCVCFAFLRVCVCVCLCVVHAFVWQAAQSFASLRFCISAAPAQLAVAQMCAIAGSGVAPTAAVPAQEGARKPILGAFGLLCGAYGHGRRRRRVRLIASRLLGPLGRGCLGPPERRLFVPGRSGSGGSEARAGL